MLRTLLSLAGLLSLVLLVFTLAAPLLLLGALLSLFPGPNDYR